MFKSFIGGFAIKIMATISAFLFDLLVARFLGAREAGYFFLSQAVIVILASVIRQGFDNAIVRYTASYRAINSFNQVQKLLGYALIRVFVLAVGVSVALLFFSKEISDHIFRKPELFFSLRVFALILLPLTLSQILGYFFQGHKKIVIAMLYQSSLLAMIALCVIILFHPRTASSLSWLYLCCVVIVFISAIYHAMKSIGVQWQGYSVKEKSQLNKTLKPLFIIIVISQIAQWIAPIFLGMWMPSTAVSYFSAAMKTAKVTSFMLIIVNSTTAPRFAEAFKLNNVSEIRRVAIQSARLMAIVAIPMLIVILLFSPLIMRAFGSDFVIASNILRILAVGQFINAMTGAVGYILQMTGYEKYLRNSMFISIALLILLLCALVPFWGMYGAAYAVAIAMSLENLICAYQVKRKLGFNTLIFWQKI